MQAATIVFKMACYTLGPLAFVDLMFTVRKGVMLWGAQAGLNLVVVDTRMWELLPVFLILAAGCALLTEVGLTPFTTCVWFTQHTGAQACHTSTKHAKT